MICVSIQNRTYPEIVDILQGDGVEMAEIRLDLCPLGDDEITELFENSDTPLLASCPSAAIKAANPDMRPWEADLEAERRLSLAVKAGARFADLDVAASATISKRFQKLCHSNGTELIRSYHNFEETPDSGLLADIIARCFRYGAAIAKIAVTARTAEDCERVAQLYAGEQERGTLIAFCMGDEGQESRFDSIRLGAPFLYAALGDDDGVASHLEITSDCQREAVEGVAALHGCTARVGCDYIEAGSYITAAAVTGGELTLTNVEPEPFKVLEGAFARFGVSWTFDAARGELHYAPRKKLRMKYDLGDAIPSVADGIWPAFPSDLLSILIVLATQTRGTCLFFEKMFESRLYFVDHLKQMGAKIVQCDPHRVVVTGPCTLVGGTVTSPDIRAGIALVIAALCAKGETTILNAESIDRGYVSVEESLGALGAEISRK